MDIQEISKDVTLEKYAKGVEAGVEDIFPRVAKGLASVEEEELKTQCEEEFLSAMNSGMCPAGRVLSAAGTDITSTLINCFVQPIADSIRGKDEQGRPGIFVALEEAAETMRRGGGVGYSFDQIRPRKAIVNGTQSNASGPVSYMRVFDRACETIESAGARRGAQMAVLRSDHPDIREFIHAKDKEGELKNFNISVACTDEFMEAVKSGSSWELVHEAKPNDDLIDNGAGFDITKKKWVYEVVDAASLYKEIMASTYDHAEPGIILVDAMNTQNNLQYCEVIEACNPCGEQALPSYGACCLGSLNLTRFVRNPFKDDASFDFVTFIEMVRTGIRMLDNVLDLSYWPLEAQKLEAMSKRRVGLGFTGLGNALTMLGVRYDSVAGLKIAEEISMQMRNAAYRASVVLAKEKGAFPLFDAEKYLASPFVQRLPGNIKEDIAKYGIRNSHLLSIAPTGTMSLAIFDNVSNGIEPAFSWMYERKKRMPNGETVKIPVEDYAYRVYRNMGGDIDNLPDSFVSALEIGVVDHMEMMVAVQPYIDSAISKTVNIPVDYDFDDFCQLYFKAWESGLKGLATFRPNEVTGSVLSVKDDAKKLQPVEDLDDSDPDRRIRIEKVPDLVLSSLRWQKRPRVEGGNPSWTYLIEHPYAGDFAVFVGHVENGENHPFEVWINGAEAPRGLGVLAKSLSMDLRSEDRAWLKKKLESLLKVVDAPFEMVMPDGKTKPLNGTVAALAHVLIHRCTELGVFNNMEKTPLLDALISPKEPKTGPDGTLSWTVDIFNPATGDDFVMGLKEYTLPDGSRRPYSVWLSGNYPKAFDGLCKTLSYDMRVYDPAWFGKKLRQLLDYAEPLGDFLARVPGDVKQINYPSTIAYMATLILHRHMMLGILDDKAMPVVDMGGMALVHDSGEAVDMKPVEKLRSVGAMAVVPGKLCDECGSYAVTRVGGCDFCSSCGAQGSCG